MWDRLRLPGAFVLALAAAVSGCASQTPQDAMSLQRMGRQQTVAFNRAMEMVHDLKYEQAAGQFESLAVALDQTGPRPKAAEAIFWRGFCYEKMGRTTEAMMLYGQCVQKDPSSLAARQAADRQGWLLARPSPEAPAGQ